MSRVRKPIDPRLVPLLTKLMVIVLQFLCIFLISMFSGLMMFDRSDAALFANRTKRENIFERLSKSKISMIWIAYYTVFFIAVCIPGFYLYTWYVSTPDAMDKPKALLLIVVGMMTGFCLRDYFLKRIIRGRQI